VRHRLNLYPLLFGFFVYVQSAAAESLIIPRIDRAPVLNGKEDDPCWTKAAVVTNFSQPGSEAAPKKPIEARVCCDDSALYLFIACSEPEMAKVKAAAKLRNEQVWHDDCVEVWTRVGTDKLDFDQFISNSIGTQEEQRKRAGKNVPFKATWEVKTNRSDTGWSAEFKIPAADLALNSLTRGEMLGLKIGREDKVSDGLSIWPAGAPYSPSEPFGRAYIEDDNLVINPTFMTSKGWQVDAKDAEVFKSATDGGTQVIQINSPARYASLNQPLKLRPNSFYKLSADVKASGTMILRVRTKTDKDNKFDIAAEPSPDYRPYAVRFNTGADGVANLLVSVTETSGTGAFFVKNLKVSADLPPSATGPAIPIKSGEAISVTKLMVSDCRSVRGFIIAPVDGTLKSTQWDGGTWEYNAPGAGAGVGYRYFNNDGLHITFADDKGFNAVVVRGGVKAKLLRDVAKYDEPASGTPVFEFPGQTSNSRAYFAESVKTKKVSFFEVKDGRIADCSFYRVEPVVADAKPGAPYYTTLGGKPSALVEARLNERFAADERTVITMEAGEKPLTEATPKVDTDKAIHLISKPLDAETVISALELNFSIHGTAQNIPFTIRVQDPLNPRLELHGADYVLDKAGPVRLLLNFPDQIVPKGNAVWITVRFDQHVSMQMPTVSFHSVPREQAAPEALAHRLFLLRGFYSLMSEARPWNLFHKPEDIDKLMNDPKSPYKHAVKEILETLDQCRAIDAAGKDDTVRQYYQWIYRSILRKSADGLPPFPTRFDKIDGVPEWAVLARQAWLQCREVPKWWIENRLTPNGELGGEVGDDTDMFGNYAAFPWLERDGVGGMVLDAATRLAETAQKNLSEGINVNTTDALHAYEEGLNLDAQMPYWFYGDPVYVERCLIAARSLEKITILTPKGHRHFKDHRAMGAIDLRMDRKLAEDGFACPLMWHQALEAADYNRMPRVMKMLREWADGWMEHQEPGKYASLVDVATETVKTSDPVPFSGGWGLQGTVHMYIAALTGEAKYIKPYLDYLAENKTDETVRRMIYELQQQGMLDVPKEKMTDAIKKHWAAEYYLNGDKTELIKALKTDVEELQRFKHMYTTVECFTDRVFLYAIINPSIAYTGGYLTRNKLCKNFAVSWENLGTDYAALVGNATSSQLKLLVCNVSDKPIEGKMRVWRLQHGEYELTIGPDADNDDKADKIERTEKLELQRASEIAIKLPPKTVQVLELKQLKKLDDIVDRADLALSKMELKVDGNEVSAVAHNIGVKDVDDAVVAIVDAAGKVLARKQLGKIPAAQDLVPKPVPFDLTDLPADLTGLSVMLDPENNVSEIYEGNNRLPLK
jgi:hypothetical protein